VKLPVKRICRLRSTSQPKFEDGKSHKWRQTRNSRCVFLIRGPAGGGKSAKLPKAAAVLRREKPAGARALANLIKRLSRPVSPRSRVALPYFFCLVADPRGRRHYPAQPRRRSGKKTLPKEESLKRPTFKGCKRGNPKLNPEKVCLVQELCSTFNVEGRLNQ